MTDELEEKVSFTLRLRPGQRERWEKAAEGIGMPTLAAFVRFAAEKVAAELVGARGVSDARGGEDE